MVRGCTLLAFATNFHVLVGGWATIVAVGSLMITSNQTIRMHTLKLAPLYLIVSLPGLVTTYNAVFGETIVYPELAELKPSLISLQANYLQVFHRLRYHLDPATITWQAYGLYLFFFLATGSTLICSSYLNHKSRTWKYRFLAVALVLGALLVLTGVLLGARTGSALEMPFLKWRVALLKFYWFRFADILIALCFASFLSIIILRLWESVYPLSKGSYKMPVYGGVLLLLITLWLPPHPGHEMTNNALHDWKTLGGYVQKMEDENSVFITPMNSWAFAWYFQRNEYVIFKNCPQDSASMVEWNRRLQVLTRFRAKADSDNTYSPHEIQQLSELTGADYLIVENTIAVEKQAPLKTIGMYSLYKLPE